MARLPILLLFLFHGIEAQEGQTVNVAALQTSLDNLHSALFGTKDQAPRTGVLADTLGNVYGIIEFLSDDDHTTLADHFSPVIQRLNSVDSEVELIIQAAIRSTRL